MEQQIKIGNVTVTVVRPTLKPEERTQREKEIKQALIYYNEKR